MTIAVSKRSVLKTAAALAALSGLPAALRPARAAEPMVLRAARRTLEVKGRAASVYGLTQADGSSGVFLDPDQRFLVQLVNGLDEPTIIHWHGQAPPANQDGVAMTGLEQVIAAGATQPYDFAARPGTHWMHSHQGLQEMQLLAAPLIVRTAADLRMDAQEVTVILHDFTFRTPEQVMADLGSMGGMQMGGAAKTDDKMAGMKMGNADSGGMAGMKMGDAGGKAEGEDFNDIDFDAYLANDRTLDDPLVVRTERHGRVRLRLINAGSATSFWIDLGALTGTVIAVDGMPVQPVTGKLFPLAEAQRIDIVVDVPAGQACPILAQRVGDTARTGIILAAPGASVARIDGAAAKAAGGLGNGFEMQLTAATPLAAKPVDRRHSVVLTGSMSPYQWFINGQSWENHQPLRVKQGQRVAIEFVNNTPMAHPMHLHGHAFQVVALNGTPLNGALRDTINLPPRQSATVAFDADNPGRWLVHCHILPHMETGMITEVAYET